MASLANTTSVTLNLVLRMAIERVSVNIRSSTQLEETDAERELNIRSSQRGPSRVAQLKPCLIDSLTVVKSFLSTWCEENID